MKQRLEPRKQDARLKSLLLLSAFLFILSYALPANAAPIEEADRFYARRYDPGNVEEAVEILESILEVNPRDYEACWRMARICWYLGDKASGRQRIALFDESRRFAEAAVAADGNKLEGHYWLASALASLALEKGIIEALLSITAIRRHMDECVRIAPEDARTRNLRALFFWKLPGILGGNLKLAEEEAWKAVSLAPENPVFWGVLGGILEQRKDYVGARQAFNKLLSLPDRIDDPIEGEKFKKEAAEALRRMEGR